MEKVEAVQMLGQTRLLLPSWIRAALAANERLKVYLSVLQAAQAHAQHPARDLPDLGREIGAAGLDPGWLRDLEVSARCVDGELLVPDLGRLLECLANDLALMARPLAAGAPQADSLQARARRWTERLAALPADRLSDEQLAALTQGRHGPADSLHVLVMDLHRHINGLWADLATESIDGARAWGLRADDRPRVAAFMRGLQRTAYLKFDHPGLETVATRDGERLLLQNDIGTNDAHVLVLQVGADGIELTYSDMHGARFAFFRDLLTTLGARWGETAARSAPGLNRGEAFVVGMARFICADSAALDAALEGIGSSLVFLIDWNRARKRLQAFLRKGEAIALLGEAARRAVGHRAWLQAGGERLVFGAMQAIGEGAFRIGDRLDEVLGSAGARDYLLALFELARDALRRGQPPAFVADEARMMLARHVRHRTGEFELLAEHAAYCQELAQAVSAGLAHGAEQSTKDAQHLAARAKQWERKADLLVTQAREKAQRQPRWRPIARLAEVSDNIVDALEEAAFLVSLIADGHARGWNADVHKVLTRLAATVLQATQDHVRALAIARTLGSDSEWSDNDGFLATTWRVLEAERECDDHLRDARRVIFSTLQDAASLALADDLAACLEASSDHLLTAAYALREVAFDRAGDRP